LQENDLGAGGCDDTSMGRQRIKPAPTPPTTTRGRRTRDALILAGREVLEQQGWSGFSPEAVAQAAGVSYGTFYTYFESKDDLLHHVVRSVAGEMFASSLVPTDRVEDPYARIVESNRLYLRAWDQASKVLRLADQGGAATARRRRTRPSCSSRTSGSRRRTCSAT
jgi:AcrR family transcriptional regulator